MSSDLAKSLNQVDQVSGLTDRLWILTDHLSGNSTEPVKWEMSYPSPTLAWTHKLVRNGISSSARTTPTHPSLSPIHSFATLPISLYTQEQGWTLELEKEGERKGKEERLKKRRRRREAPAPFQRSPQHLHPNPWLAQVKSLSFLGCDPKYLICVFSC